MMSFLNESNLDLTPSTFDDSIGRLPLPGLHKARVSTGGIQQLPIFHGANVVEEQAGAGDPSGTVSDWDRTPKFGKRAPGRFLVGLEAAGTVYRFELS